MNVVMQEEKRRSQQLLSDPCRSRPVSRARGDVLRGEGESRANNMMYLTRSRQKTDKKILTESYKQITPYGRKYVTKLCSSALLHFSRARRVSRNVFSVFFSFIRSLEVWSCEVQRGLTLFRLARKESDGAKEEEV